MEQKYGQEASTKLATIPKHGQLTQQEAMHVLRLVYPNAPDDEVIRCAILCRDFGLHPLMKEVYLIPFKKKDAQGKVIGEDYVTVLGINATRKLMAQRGTYSYIDDTPRLMTEAEQKRIFGEVDSLNIVSITKLRTKDGLEAPGYGRWPKNKEPQGTEKGNTKANMSFIRSERNAFGRLSPDALPPDVEVIDEAYTELPDTSKVDLETGEITGGKATEVKEKSASQPSTTEEHWCQEHDCAFELKKSRFGAFYSHKIKGGYCKEKKSDVQPELAPAPVEQAAEIVEEPPPEPGEEVPPRSTEELYTWVAKMMDWKDTQPVRTWLVNKLKIEEALIDSDPVACYHEIKALMGW